MNDQEIKKWQAQAEPGSDCPGKTRNITWNGSDICYLPHINDNYSMKKKYILETIPRLPSEKVMSIGENLHENISPTVLYKRTTHTIYDLRDQGKSRTPKLSKSQA